MKPYRKIVFVCESGTCRAPMAEGILREHSLNNPVEIVSRGHVVLFPEPLNQKAEAVLISNGITMEGYMSSQITQEDFGEDTLVLASEEQLRQKLLETFPDSNPEDVRVLTEFVGDELEIINPYGGTLQEYGLCYETLNRSIKKLVNLLNNKGE